MLAQVVWSGPWVHVVISHCDEGDHTSLLGALAQGGIPVWVAVPLSCVNLFKVVRCTMKFAHKVVIRGLGVLHVVLRIRPKMDAFAELCLRCTLRAHGLQLIVAIHVWARFHRYCMSGCCQGRIVFMHVHTVKLNMAASPC